MELTIKELKTMEGHDGLAFRCSVSVNGKRAFVASNDGNGGYNLYTPVNGDGYAVIHEVEAWAKTLPERTADLGGRPFTYEPDLDCVLEDLISAELDRRWLKNQCRTKTLFKLPDTPEGQWMTVSAPYDEQVAEWLANKYPDAVIANGTV